VSAALGGTIAILILRRQSDALTSRGRVAGDGTPLHLHRLREARVLWRAIRLTAAFVDDIVGGTGRQAGAKGGTD